MEDNGGSFYDYLTISLLNDRTIYLDADIDSMIASDIVKSFHLLAQKPESILLLITTGGGSVPDAEAIAHSIQYARQKGCTVVGEVCGYAMSAGAYILQNCDMRYAGHNDLIMVHGISGMSIGDIRNQEADAELTRNITKHWAQLFSNRNTSEAVIYHGESFWTALFKDSLPHYYFGDEALDTGLIDKVIN